MLFEKITYQDDFPINITIANVKDYPLHYHQDIEFVFVLKGEVTLKNGSCFYTLRQGDIFTNSGHEVHGITSSDSNNIVALIQISTHYFSQYFPSLSKACYRTYTNKSRTGKHDKLQEKLLTILLQHAVKSSKYKSACTYAMIDVIKYLEKLFNLFAFNGNVVINFENNNQITIERISRIIGYIYQNYAEKITLEDLAEIEHLSTFYISHIIKDYTGMNFRDFLCFARVEWSEIQLLDTTKKISQIAHDVGFSTTAYYEKYFKKWFGCSPQEHREKFMPMVKSDLHQEVLIPTPPNKAIKLIRQLLSSLNSQKNSTSLVNSLKLEIESDIHDKPLCMINHKLNLEVSFDDFMALGYNIFSFISQLNPCKVTLISEKQDDSGAEKLKMLLEDAGFTASISSKGDARPVSKSAVNDSIVMPMLLLRKWLRSAEEWISVPLRDCGSSEHLLTGLPSLLTSNGIKKPSYWAYQILSSIKGNLIDWGKQYCIIASSDEKNPWYMVIAMNYNDDIVDMYTHETTIHQVKGVLDDFKDELDLNVSMNLSPGMYTVIKYSMLKNHNIFAYLSSFDFGSESVFMNNAPYIIHTEPEIEIYVDDVRTSFNINFTITGAGLQIAILKPREDSEDFPDMTSR